MDLTTSSTIASGGFGALAMNGDEYVRCTKCGYGGCDVRVVGCGCTLHARCTPIPKSTSASNDSSRAKLTHCPSCRRDTSGLVLFPMSFREMDEARKTAICLASTGTRGRGSGSRGKRKSTDENDEKQSFSPNTSEPRVGRWTAEETNFCDLLIAEFKNGNLPLSAGLKLNDFLAHMLNSKQSRLTKKRKNAKLSSKTYQVKTGHLGADDGKAAQRFSELEDAFFLSVTCHLERAQVKFHMQKEWREQFSNFCASVGQPLDANAWLSSIDEMDRRASLAKDAARMVRRKLMMGFALREDSKHAKEGVFIERAPADKDQQAAAVADMPLGITSNCSVDPAVAFGESDEMLSLLADAPVGDLDMMPPGDTSMGASGLLAETNGKASRLHSAPFLNKAISYLERHGVPFEYLDLWVPSFVAPATEDSTGSNAQPQKQEEAKCRLCFAGSSAVEVKRKPAAVDSSGQGGTYVALSQDEQFNLLAFGDYSQKFSFDVGCGLPGRVYQSGLPTWEQSVQNAPHQSFERCGGAIQWGIKTVLGIPVNSPVVGRIVVVLYSRHDRTKDQDLVVRLMDEFNRLMPSPTWKLVVDIGEPEPSATSAVAAATPASNMTSSASSSSSDNKSSLVRDERVSEVVSLLGEHMPSDPNSPSASYFQGFMSLRLMLLRPSRTTEEEDIVSTMLESFTSYSAAGGGSKSKQDIATLLVRDFMYLTQPQMFSFGGSASTISNPCLGGGLAASSLTATSLADFSQHSSSNSLLQQLPPNEIGFQVHSPTLTPIPMNGGGDLLTGADSLSIVSM